MVYTKPNERYPDKMKRFFVIILTVIMTVGFTACSCSNKKNNDTAEVVIPTHDTNKKDTQPEPTPVKTAEEVSSRTVEEVTEVFFEYARNLDFESIRQMSEDKKEIIQESAEPYEAAFKAVFAPYAKKLEYEIIKIDGDESKKSVTAKCKYIDCQPYLAEVIKTSIIDSISKTIKGEISGPEDYVQVAIDTMFSKAEILGDTYAERTIVLEFAQSGMEWKLLSLNADSIAVITMNFSEYGADLINYWDKGEGK